MAELFAEHPEALATTLEIADKVEEYSLEHKPLMPNFPIPENFPIDLDQLKEVFSKKLRMRRCWLRLSRHHRWMS